MFKFLTVLAAISTVAAYCGSDESRITSIAKKDSQGKSPDGMCYSHVADYIDASGYGGINKGGFDDAIPSAYWQYAYQFAEYLNTGNNAANLCLENVQKKYSNNPYKAPTGTIVVVRAGTPGTANPVAGDIAIVGDGDYFWNGGEMGYGGSQNFPSSNNYVLGIYAPTSCCGSCNGGGGGGGDCSPDCANCIHYSGGKACADRCQGCSDACLQCVNGGGGTACEKKCQPSSMLVENMLNNTHANFYNGRFGVDHANSKVKAATSCNDITTESKCMSSSDGGEKCAWCKSAAVSDACNKESDAKALPASVFDCEYQ